MEVCADPIIKRTEQMEAKLAGYKTPITSYSFK
jgi:hypothetical protein